MPAPCGCRRIRCISIAILRHEPVAALLVQGLHENCGNGLAWSDVEIRDLGRCAQAACRERSLAPVVAILMHELYENCGNGLFESGFSWLEGQCTRVDAAYAEWRDRYLDLNGLRGEHQALQARIDTAEARAAALTAERDGLSRLKRSQRKALAAQIEECRSEIASLVATREGLFRR